jgi:hypothetical protein
MARSGSLAIAACSMERITKIKRTGGRGSGPVAGEAVEMGGEQRRVYRNGWAMALYQNRSVGVSNRNGGCMRRRIPAWLRVASRGCAPCYRGKRGLFSDNIESSRGRFENVRYRLPPIVHSDVVLGMLAPRVQAFRRGVSGWAGCRGPPDLVLWGTWDCCRCRDPAFCWARGGGALVGAGEREVSRGAA